MLRRGDIGQEGPDGVDGRHEVQLDLAAPVGKYLDGLALEVSKLTIHQLLSHTSGLKQGWPAGKLPNSSASLSETARLLTAASFFEEPTRTFSYSNLGFALAGAVLPEQRNALATLDLDVDFI